MAADEDPATAPDGLTDGASGSLKEGIAVIAGVVRTLPHRPGV